MKQVNREEFFGPIMGRKLNVTPEIVNSTYPYTSIWKYLGTQMRPPYGKTVGRKEGGREVTDYYINEDST